MSLIPKKGTVYVVDDDEGVRDSLQWLLEGKDYRAKPVESQRVSSIALTRAALASSCATRPCAAVWPAFRRQDSFKKFSVSHLRVLVSLSHLSTR